MLALMSNKPVRIRTYHNDVCSNYWVITKRQGKRSEHWIPRNEVSLSLKIKGWYKGHERCPWINIRGDVILTGISPY